MLRRVVSLFGLCLIFFPSSQAAGIEERIAAALGREKLRLILQLFMENGRVAGVQVEPQSLEGYARQALALSRQLSDRNAEGQAWRYLALSEHAQKLYEAALEDSLQARRSLAGAGDNAAASALDREVSSLFSELYGVFSDLDRARGHLDASLRRSRQEGDLAATAKCLHDIGNVLRAQGRYREAIAAYLEALRLNDRAGAPYDCGTILCNLSDACLKSGDMAASTRFLRQAIDFFKQKRQTMVQARARLQDGMSAMKRGDLAGAEPDFQQALETYGEFDEMGRMAEALDALGQLHSRLRQGEAAKDYFRQAEFLRQRKEDQQEIARVLLAHAEGLLQRRELQKAEALLLYCENYANRKHLQERLREIYVQMGELYGLRQDPLRALYYQSMGKKAWDGFLSIAVLAGTQQLLAKYESEKEIGRIRRQKRLQAAIALLAIGLLLVLLAMLAWRQKSLRKWLRDHFSSQEQRLHKKKARLREMLQRLDPEPQGQGQERAPAAGVEKDNDCLRRVLRLMRRDKSYLDSDMTLKKMAARAGISPASLSRALNRDLSMKFSDFVNHFRVEEAKGLLLATGPKRMDVIDVCFEVGFNSLSSFYRVFKMHTGTTPAEFQRVSGG